MCDNHYRKTAQTHGNPSLLSVVKPNILKGEGGPGENLMYIGEVNAVFLEISLPFPFIPSESHEYIIHIIMRVTRRFSFQGYRNMRPIIPEWDVNSVSVNEVANVQEWSGAANRSQRSLP